MIKISNIKYQISNKKNLETHGLQAGYTLVELLAVIVIMVVVGSIVATIIVNSLRGTSKTNVLNSVRQNGNYTILQMSKMIAYAQYFNGVSTDGTTYTTNCTGLSATPSPSPSPSSTPLPTPTPTPTPYKSIKITSFDGGITVFSCNGSADTPPNTIASNSASLIDTSAVSLVANSCYFTCTQNGFGLPPTIGINFTLSQAKTSGFAEQNASIPFVTSITMRNIGF